MPAPGLLARFSSAVRTVPRLRRPLAIGTVSLLTAAAAASTIVPASVSAQAPDESVSTTVLLANAETNSNTTRAGVYVDSLADDGQCPPSGDPILASANVRRGLAEAMRLSRPEALPGTGRKRERGGVIWRAPDGTYHTQEYIDKNATECRYTLPYLDVRPPEPGWIMVAKYHTHPSARGEEVYGCAGYAQFPSDGRHPMIADPDNDAFGGGSPEDWESTRDGYPLYAITKSGHIYRFDPDTPERARKDNPNRWEISDGPGCLARITRR